MNRLFFIAAFLLGAAAVIWMASTFVGTNNLALTVTLVIACVYSIGFMELLQFRVATATLERGLNTIPGDIAGSGAALDKWLGQLHPSLYNAVRLRIEGERVGLPAPVVTPYLVGLLVMLGLLGTFVGMVETLSGAVIALEGTTELQAIRAGLAAPIQGLSVAFGTSVAGVAASAMLGLISTLSRRDRMLATRVLDGKIGTVFRGFSLAHNRQQTYLALQAQAQALPEVADKLNTMAEKLSRASENLSDELITSQLQFHESAQAVYQELATSVGASLNAALAESGRMAGESIKPVVAEAMADISREAKAVHQSMTETAQTQLETLSASFGETSKELGTAWNESFHAHEQANEKLTQGIGESFDALNGRFEVATTALLDSFGNASSSWAKQREESDNARLEQWVQVLAKAQESSASQLASTSQQFTEELRQSTELQQASLASASESFKSMSGAVTSQWESAGSQIGNLVSTLKNELSTLKKEEEARGIAAVDRLGELESVVSSHLLTLGKEMEEPLARLIETASETPKAAAEVIGKLRDEVSNNIERDNNLLVERRKIMEQLNTLSISLEKTSSAQGEALEGLVSKSARIMEKIGDNFAEQVETRLGDMANIAENFSGSATEMAAMGEAFSVAVGLFNESNEKLMSNLANIEQSLDNSNARSDEQMNYYVAQARQIIDQSMQSQREIFEELRQLGASGEQTLDEAS